MTREEIHALFNADGDIEIADALDYAIIKTQQEYENRSCENCKYFNLEIGTQSDGLGWEKVECEQGIINQCMEADYTLLSCTKWEEKK
jgi:hypothetical protein